VKSLNFKTDLRFQSSAAMALQESSESYLDGLCENTTFVHASDGRSKALFLWDAVCLTITEGTRDFFNIMLAASRGARDLEIFFSFSHLMSWLFEEVLEDQQSSIYFEENGNKF